MSKGAATKTVKRDRDDAVEAYLAELGERVRKARAARGMSRKILAQDSGVSERYLAQLEGGAGNVSIVLLRQIAQALGQPLAELVAEGPDESVDLRLAYQFLTRLDEEQLSEARTLLQRSFTPCKPASKAARIALIGLRGAGKTTLGRLLAGRLKVPFVEVNKVIEEEAGAPVAELFSLYGQPTYRRYERQALERIIRENPSAVIATGGGIVAEPTTFDLLLSSCHTVWLTARPDEHMERVVAQGDMRPMADNRQAMEDLRQILSAREPYYAKAEKTVSTAGKSVEEALDDLLKVVAS